MNDMIQQLATFAPALVAQLKGNPDALAEFTRGYQQTLAQQQEQQMRQQSMTQQGEDRARMLTRQQEQDKIAAEDRARRQTLQGQQDALTGLAVPGQLAELGATALTPDDAKALIESVMPRILEGFGPTALAYGQPAVEMATRTITGRQKKAVEAYVDAALKTSFVVDNPDHDPELAQLPEHIAKIVGKPSAKLSELQTFAQLPVGKPQGKTRTPPAVGSLEDFVSRAYGDAPTSEQILKARKAYNQSDDKPGVPVDPEIVALRKELLQLQVDRASEPKPTKEPNQAQFTSAGYAGRMAQAEPILTKVAPGIVGMSLPSFTMQTDSWFAKPTFQSAEVQSYMQAARNFINAVLRRESGAVISPQEFAEARQQYLPVAGDKPDALAQKAANRAYVFNTMKRSSGDAYEPPVTPPAPGGSKKAAAVGDKRTIKGQLAEWDGKGWKPIP